MESQEPLEDERKRSPVPSQKVGGVEDVQSGSTGGEGELATLMNTVLTGIIRYLLMQVVNY